MGRSRKSSFLQYLHASPALLLFTCSTESRLEHPGISLATRPPGEKWTTRGHSAALPPSSRFNLSARSSGTACKALTQVTEGEGSPGEDEGSRIGAAPRRGRGAPGLWHRRLAESCAASDSEVRARARAPGALQLRLAPAGLRYLHATKSEIKLWPASGCPAPGPGPAPRPEMGWGLSTVLHPRYPARTPLTTRPGLPVRPRVRGASAARSPWGERETV